MKLANAIKLHRKSGVRLGERGARVPFPLQLFGVSCAEMSADLVD
jgi:hypothetical protein